MQKSPIFSRIQSRLSKDKAEIKELALIANPEFNAEYRPYVSKAIDQDEEYEISLVQPLKLGDFGKRQKKLSSWTLWPTFGYRLCYRVPAFRCFILDDRNGTENRRGNDISLIDL